MKISRSRFLLGLTLILSIFASQNALAYCCYIKGKHRCGRACEDKDARYSAFSGYGCSQEQIFRGCRTLSRQHCYPKIGCEGTSHFYCSCPRKLVNSQYANEDALVGMLLTDGISQDGETSFDEKKFTGVRCGPHNPKTGSQTCCNYKNGVITSCRTSN